MTGIAGPFAMTGKGVCCAAASMRLHDGGTRRASASSSRILMVVLLGFAAIAVDVGALLRTRPAAERCGRRGLMMAQKCARNERRELLHDRSTGRRASPTGTPWTASATSSPSPSTRPTARHGHGRREGNRAAHRTMSPCSSPGFLGFNSAEVIASSSVQWGSPVRGHHSSSRWHSPSARSRHAGRRHRSCCRTTRRSQRRLSTGARWRDRSRRLRLDRTRTPAQCGGTT